MQKNVVSYIATHHWINNFFQLVSMFSKVILDLHRNFCRGELSIASFD